MKPSIRSILGGVAALVAVGATNVEAQTSQQRGIVDPVAGTIIFDLIGSAGTVVGSRLSGGFPTNVISKIIDCAGGTISYANIGIQIQGQAISSVDVAANPDSVRARNLRELCTSRGLTPGF